MSPLAAVAAERTFVIDCAGARLPAILHPGASGARRGVARAGAGATEGTRGRLVVGILRENTASPDLDQLYREVYAKLYPQVKPLFRAMQRIGL